MSKFKEKEQALVLRRTGKSINEIAKQLGVSKSTVSYWCRDILLSAAAIKRIAVQSKKKSTEALLESSERQRLQRFEETTKAQQRGKDRLSTLTSRDIFCLGLGLYWGEGYKKGGQEFGFTNSDPKMLLFYIVWLQSVFNVTKKDLILRVSINQQHTNRINEVEKYWVSLLKIPISQFTKPSLIKSVIKKEYNNKNTHMGTLRIKVRRGTTYRREILGSIEEVFNQI